MKFEAMDEIIKEISARIDAVEKRSSRANVGTIISLADGVARLDGLSEAMYNEMIDFGGGVTGIALNLGEDEVGCILLGDASNIKEGGEARTTGKLLSVPVGKGWLGRVVDALGRRLTARAKSPRTAFIPLKKSPRAYFRASPSTSRCKRGYLKSTPCCP